MSCLSLRYAWAALVLAAAMAYANYPERRAGSFSDGGFYVAGDTWGGTLNHRRAHPERTLDYDQLLEARQRGSMNVVQLDGPGRWLGDPDEMAALLRDWLVRNESNLPLIDVLHLSEEQPYNAGPKLDALYDIIKDFAPDLPVYVWPSMTLGPIARRFDGWVYDTYGTRYDSFRNRWAPAFLGTGAPLIMCVDASGYSSLDAAREQVLVSKEFDLPVFYFAADSGSGSSSNWLYGFKPTYIPRRNFLFSALEFQNRSRGAAPLVSADFLWGDPIELVPDHEGRVHLAWRGRGPATVYGFTRLVIQENSLQTDGRAVALDYQFWSRFPVRAARLALAIDGDASLVIVEQARYGMSGPSPTYRDSWRPAPRLDPDDNGMLLFDLGDVGQEFRVRVTLGGPAGAVTLCRGMLTAQAPVPTETAVALDPWFDGWARGVRYHQDLTAGQWRILGGVDKPDLLEPGTTPALRGVPGYRAAVEIIQKFTADRPLREVQVRLRGSYNRNNMGGSFSLGVSLDGHNIVARGTPDGPDSAGHYRGVHTLDLRDESAFHGVREFYVHMRQSNTSGVRSHISSRLSELEIDARYE